MSNFKLDAAIDAAILAHLPRQQIKDCYAQAPGDDLRGKFARVCGENKVLSWKTKSFPGH
jgi:hypothetical protein